VAAQGKTLQMFHRERDTMLEGMKPPPNRAYSCRVAQVMAQLDQADKDILTQALNAIESWPARTLSNELKKRNVSLADTTITRHRQLICQCRRES
jgi:hypothetical protein